MTWGTAAYLSNNEEVVTTYTPYNLIKLVPVAVSAGTHSFTVSELPPGTTMDYSIESFTGVGKPGTPLISSVSVSGNKLTYTVSYAYSAGIYPYNQRIAFAIYARR